MADKEEPRPCARCGFVNETDDKHCIKCGAPLLNKCSDEPGLISKGCSFVNKPDAAFCAKCGQPTIFNHHGIVPPYQGVKWSTQITK